MNIRSIILPCVLIVWLGGCAAELPPEAFAEIRPNLRPEEFFSGTTNSTGVLEDRSGAPLQRFQVAGTGVTLPDGDFQLDQTVTFEQKPPETRRWIMHRDGEHHYTAELTDAVGPVQAEAYGNLFHLTYSMRRPLAGYMEQWLYLQPDGRTVVNEATISILGITVARLSERITHEAR